MKKIIGVLLFISLNIFSGNYKDEWGFERWYAWENKNYKDCEKYGCFKNFKEIEVTVTGFSTGNKTYLKYDDFKATDINGKIYTEYNWPSKTKKGPEIILSEEVFITYIDHYFSNWFGIGNSSEEGIEIIGGRYKYGDYIKIVPTKMKFVAHFYGGSYALSNITANEEGTEVLIQKMNVFDFYMLDGELYKNGRS